MTTVRTRALAILIVGIVVSLVGSSVPADTLPYYTDFSDTPTGQVPADWTVLSNGTWEVNVNDELVLTAVTDDSSIVCETAGTLTDFTVSATFHNGAGRAGIVGRLQNDEVFYVLRVSGQTYLDLYWNDPSQGIGYGQIAHVALDPDYVYGQMCTMSMTFEGSSISGWVRNSSDVVMGSFAVVDTHIASGGEVGLRANKTSFGCTEFQVVPEPGVVALLISALTGLLVVRRKR